MAFIRLSDSLEAVCREIETLLSCLDQVEKQAGKIVQAGSDPNTQGLELELKPEIGSYKVELMRLGSYGQGYLLKKATLDEWQQVVKDQAAMYGNILLVPLDLKEDSFHDSVKQYRAQELENVDIRAKLDISKGLLNEAIEDTIIIAKLFVVDDSQGLKRGQTMFKEKAKQFISLAQKLTPEAESVDGTTLISLEEGVKEIMRLGTTVETSTTAICKLINSAILGKMTL